jgi:uncharacterized protein DUF3237
MSPYELENLPQILKRVRTQPIFVIRLEVMPLQVIGKTRGAHRRVGVVTGGEFYGKHFSGRVLGGGSDWIIVRDDQAVELDVRLVLQTHDDALIAMTYRADPRPERPQGWVRQRLLRGSRHRNQSVISSSWSWAAQVGGIGLRRRPMNRARQGARAIF